MRDLALVLLVLVVPLLSSADGETHLHLMMRAKSAHQLEAAASFSGALSHRRELCNEELKRRLIPMTCFEVLALEEQIGIIRQARASEMSNLITESCVTATKTINKLEPLWKAFEAKRLSSVCRNTIKERIEDLKYAGASSADIFALRLN